MSRRSATEARQVQANMNRLPKTKEALKAAGFRFDWEHAGHHYRVANRYGVLYDWWASTDKWRRVGEDHAFTGHLSLIAHQSARPDLPSEVRPAERLTIITDASHDHHTQAAGWGAWLAGAAQTIVRGGPINKPMRTVNDAEIEALGRGLLVAERAGMLKPGMLVMLQSDSQSALAFVRAVCGAPDNPAPGGLAIPLAKSRVASTLAQCPALAWMRDLRDRIGFDIEARHVKGHVRNGEGRYFCNRQVDKMARAGLNQRRAALRAAHTPSDRNDPCPTNP